MSLPVVAIVGQPNVGKSTLFNRLTQTRNALVSDFAGMTRDRQYGEAALDGKRFIVIDTGGLTEEENPIDLLTVSQSLQAVKEADKILFLVDGRAGLTAGDLTIAKMLRSANKSILLVVNKMEDLDSSLVMADFHRLGLGSPIPISTAHGMGISALLSTLIPEESEEAAELVDDGSIKFAIVGRPNVGKSTLTNRMLGEERVIVYDQPGTTRDSISLPLERHGKKYLLIDTAGIRRRGKVFETMEKFSVVKTLQAIQSATVVLFLMDASEGVTEQDLHLLGFVLECGKSMVIAYNKWDGLSEEQRGHARASLDRRLSFLDYVRVHTISALHGTGVGNLFDFVDEAYASANKKVSTAMATKILLEAVTKHTPPLVHGRRIKLRYAHVGGHNPPTIIIHGNQVESLPNSYRQYLVHAYQKKLKLVGTPVKIELRKSDNPFEGRKNTLTPLQKRKKMRMLRHVKKGK
jgi:GTP-binding protein